MKENKCAMKLNNFQWETGNNFQAKEGLMKQIDTHPSSSREEGQRFCLLNASLYSLSLQDSV